MLEAVFIWILSQYAYFATCNMHISEIFRQYGHLPFLLRVAETMFSKIFGERNSTKTSKYYF